MRTRVRGDGGVTGCVESACLERVRLRPVRHGRPSITVVIFCWRNCLISKSMGHHNSEIMDDGGID